MLVTELSSMRGITSLTSNPASRAVQCKVATPPVVRQTQHLPNPFIKTLASAIPRLDDNTRGPQFAAV
jgi:hypothetical protein